MSTIVIDPTTYRFKFCTELTTALAEFAKEYSSVSRKDFQKAWTNFMDQYKDIVDSEQSRLEQLGYRGCPVDKMYKSARYYFRGKSTARGEKQTATQRKKYTPIDKNLLALISQHIADNVHDSDFSPASGFNDFCALQKKAIETAVQMLLDNGAEGRDIPARIKKAYKNRYFAMTRQT